MAKRKVLDYQNTVLKVLSHKIDDFYLSGGTALGLFYFQHRLSVDLDFFTRHLTYSRVKEIIEYLRKVLRVDIRLTAQNLEKEKTKILVYNIYFNTDISLKIDFVEDVLELIKKPKVVEGINILALEDIYIRKIYAVSGVLKISDEVGHARFIGGRIDAKDFYDLYFLSHTFMPLSQFTDKYCNRTIKEGLIRWFRTYDRMKMIDGILSLDIHKKIHYKNLEKHFKNEIDKIITKELDDI